MSKKKILLCSLMVFILVCNCFTIRAEEEKENPYEKMKADAYAKPIDTNQIKDWPQAPAIYADAAIVMDMNTGAVLMGKAIEEKHYPASITKLLTVLVALENASLTDQVEFTEDSVSFLEYDDAHIGMRPGEIIKMEDALYAILLASANEVSHAVAESVGKQYLGGDYNSFIEKMNRKSQELGCVNSHWVNSYGLHNEEHYTCAYDMAKIASALYSYETFRHIMEKNEYKIGVTNLVKEERVFQQMHKMLNPYSEYYDENCIGGKTGYTEEAMNTLVTMEEKNDMRLVAVVLHDYGAETYKDTQKMLEYGFQNFKRIPVGEKESKGEIKEFINKDATLILPSNLEFSQLEKEIVLTDTDIRSGQIVYKYDGHEVGRFDVSLTEEGYRTLSENSKKETEGKDKIEIDHSKKINVEVIFWILMLIVLIMLIVKIILLIKRRKHRKRR